MSTSRKKTPPPERFIVLLRHGIAEESAPGGKDEDRSLSAKGIARMKGIARGLAQVLPKVEAIYSSPLLRAMQTAMWASKGYKTKVEIKTTDALAPGAPSKDVRAFVDGLQQRRIILVGHEPSLSDAMRQLTGLRGTLELKKGGCYGVRIGSDGVAVLEWVLTPRVLRKSGAG